MVVNRALYRDTYKYTTGRILKKQLKLICLFHSIFLKAEGNSLERKELK